MRIVILNQYYAPDDAPTAQFAADLGAHLAASGHDVIAICANRAYRHPRRTYALRETIGGVAVRRVRTTAFGRHSRRARIVDAASFFIGAAVELLRVESPDVVVAMTGPPMIGSLPLIVGRPFIVWSMDVYPELAFRLRALRRTSLIGRALSGIAKAILRRADRVIALDDAMAAHLGTGVVIHNWSDVEYGRSPQPSAFSVAYCGNFGLVHEFETVIDAVRRLEDVQFVFAGDGPRLREVRDALRGVPNVEFRDFVDRPHVAQSLAAASVHLVTLRPDMAGLVVPSKIYGVLAAGRPAIYIGPPEGAVHEIVRDENCGATVRNGDVDALVRAIRDYATDRGRCEREGRNGRAAFERRFTKEKSLAALGSQIRPTTAS